MTTIALRAYVSDGKIITHNIFPKSTPDLIFAFDCETTSDMYQNLKFGSYMVYNKGVLIDSGLFCNPDCITKKELKILRAFSKHANIPMYTRKYFVEKKFYYWIYYQKALCIGFNLPFDLSRLAISYGYARGNMKGGFSLKLSKNPKYPRVKIKHVNKCLSFIKFGQGLDYNGKKSNFQGNFIDLKTLSFALTDKKLNLKKACERFKTRDKKLDTKHGTINKKYIEYNIND